MKKDMRFLTILFLIVCIAGCSSNDNKKTEDVITVPSQTRSFKRVVPPVIMTNVQDQVDYVLNHYWDNFDFRDTMFCHLPDITEQAFVDFIVLFPYVSPIKYSSAVKKMLDSAMVDAVMYNYFYKTGEHYLYDPNSEMRSDEYFIPFLEHVVSSSRVVEANKVRPKYLLDLAYKNRVGSKANDIIYTLNSGSTGNLYGITSQYVLLMFYNPDCKECRVTTEQLKNSTAVTAAVASGKLKVLALYPDENIEIWKKHLNSIPSSWINGYDKSLSVRNKEIYDLKAIPTLFLLDKDKIVLLKDSSIGLIHAFFEKNQ